MSCFPASPGPYLVKEAMAAGDPFFPTFSSLFKHKLTLGGGSVLWLHKSVDQLHAQWQQCLLSTSYVSGSRELFYFEEITL